MSASIEDTLTTLLSGLSAVQALGNVVIRPYHLAESDALPGSGFQCATLERQGEDDQHEDLSGRGGAVSTTVIVTSVAETWSAAWALAEAIRTNGSNPGTGLAGFKGTPAGGATIQMATANKRSTGFAYYGDASDEGFFFVRQPYEIDYLESA